jgi:LytS/YehU family sensor histidine kinase
MIAGTRVAIGMIFGVFGGPWVGIPVGAVGGLYRMSGLFWRGLRGGMGYEFAIGGFISAFVAGVLGGVLHLRGVTARTLRKNTRKILLITILWRILVIEVVYPLTALIFSELTFVESFYISNQSLLVPELISDSFAIIVFSIFLGGIVAEEERETRKLQKLLRRYEELLGPEAQRIARDVEKDFAIERMIEKRPLQSKKKSKDGKSRKGKGQK